MKKIMKIILAIGFLAGLSSASLFANPLENKNAVGLYFIGAETTVGGIQYERKITDLISSKVDVFMYYSSATTESFTYNVNAEVDFNLFEALWKERYGSKLYAYVLAGNNGDINVTTDESYFDVLLSAGFGFDFILFDHMSIPVQFGFMGAFPNYKYVGFCAGTGLRYSF